MLLAFGSGLACDQIEELRERFLGSGQSAASQAAGELESAVALYEEGQVQAAAEKLEELIRREPGLADAFYHLGRCYLSLAGDSADPSSPLSPEEERSLAAFNTALTLNPRHAGAAKGIGDLYLRRVPAGRRRRRRKDASPDALQLASDAYQKAVTIDPKSPEVQLSYARFLERAGRPEEADAAYRAAVDAAKPNLDIAPVYYTAYGRFLAAQPQRVEEAIDQLELAQMVRGEDPELKRDIAALYSRIGHSYFEDQKFSLAEQTLTKAYRLFPDKSDSEAQKTSATLNQLRAMRGR